MRILVADDVRFNQTIIAAILEAGGHRVDIVENGAEAVDAARRGGYDLILMDVQMPVMDGYHAARAIRSLGDGVGRVPILALTAAAFREDEERALSAGMNGHLAKPVNHRALLAAVQRWTGNAGDGASSYPRTIIDDSAVDDLIRYLGHERVRALARLLQVQLQHILSAIIPSGDLVKLVQEAHTLVGTAGAFGLVDLMRHAKAILMVGAVPTALDIARDLRRSAVAALAQLQQRSFVSPVTVGNESARATNSERGSTDQPSILMVEDEMYVMLNVVDFLEEEGFSIKTAATGEEALRLIQQGEHCDVLFADVRLPGQLDGLALARQLQILRPQLPVLIASGHIMGLDGTGLTKARFLPKPYSLAQVSIEIHSLISQQRNVPIDALDNGMHQSPSM